MPPETKPDPKADKPAPAAPQSTTSKADTKPTPKAAPSKPVSLTLEQATEMALSQLQLATPTLELSVAMRHVREGLAKNWPG